MSQRTERRQALDPAGEEKVQHRKRDDRVVGEIGGMQQRREHSARGGPATTPAKSGAEQSVGVHGSTDHGWGMAPGVDNIQRAVEGGEQQ
jgi:hypothetical protein